MEKYGVHHGRASRTWENSKQSTMGKDKMNPYKPYYMSSNPHKILRKERKKSSLLNRRKTKDWWQSYLYLLLQAASNQPDFKKSSSALSPCSFGNSLSLVICWPSHVLAPAPLFMPSASMTFSNHQHGCHPSFATRPMLLSPSRKGAPLPLF